MTDTAASCWWELCLRWWSQRVISPKLDNFFPTNENVSQMEKHHSCRNRASMVMSCEADVAIPRLNLLVRCFLFPSAGAVVRTEWKDFLRSCCFFCRLDSIWLILFFSPSGCSAAEPVRPIDPAAWISHTTAMTGAYPRYGMSPSMSITTSTSSSLTSSIPESESKSHCGQHRAGIFCSGPAVQSCVQSRPQPQAPWKRQPSQSSRMLFLSL